MKQLISRLKLITGKSTNNNSQKSKNAVRKSSSRKNYKAPSKKAKFKSNIESYPKKSWLNVPPENKFYVNNGQVLSNLMELPTAINEMDQETFNHHVTKDNNDFANWVDHVVGEQKLAADLRRLKSQNSMVKAIQKLL